MPLHPLDGRAAAPTNWRDALRSRTSALGTRPRQSVALQLTYNLDGRPRRSVALHITWKHARKTRHLERSAHGAHNFCRKTIFDQRNIDRMERELIDRAESIRHRILQLRDSL